MSAMRLVSVYEWLAGRKIYITGLLVRVATLLMLSANLMLVLLLKRILPILLYIQYWRRTGMGADIGHPILCQSAACRS